MLELRKIAPELRRLIIEVRAIQVDEVGSFWMIDDHDPIELYDFLKTLGCYVQTVSTRIRNTESFLEKLGLSPQQHLNKGMKVFVSQHLRTSI